MNAGVGIDQNALGGQALRAVAGDSVAVVEVAVLLRLNSIRRLLSRRAAMRPSVEMNSITARSRLATPSTLPGAVNWIRSPTENSRSISR